MDRAWIEERIAEVRTLLVEGEGRIATHREVLAALSPGADPLRLDTAEQILETLTELQLQRRGMLAELLRSLADVDAA
jgi:hypothetical protein